MIIRLKITQCIVVSDADTELTSEMLFVSTLLYNGEGGGVV